MRIMRAVILFSLSLCGLLVAVNAWSKSLSQTPLSAGARVDPNLMFIIDDSGSMRFEIMPESNIALASRFVYPRAEGTYQVRGSEYQNNVPTFDESDPYNAYSRSPQTNTLYYNPSVTYRPWVKADGARMADASPRLAPDNPAFPERGRRNLTQESTERAAQWVGSCDTITESGPSGCQAVINSRNNRYLFNYQETFYPAVYFWYKGGGYNNINNYRRTEIRPDNSPFVGEGRENRVDCANSTAMPASCTYQEEMQNFANWYTYYRSRTLAARAGVGQAFSQIGATVRVGFDTINSGSYYDTANGNVSDGVRTFYGQGRGRFYDRLYEHDVPAEGTPLRRGLQRAGNYYQYRDEPWRDDPSSNQSVGFQSCRAGYTVLMTDGYWSGGPPVGIGNDDGQAGPTINGASGQSYRYPANPPYADNTALTLADVAMNYWKRDLRVDLANDLPVSGQDPAFWQHMTSFGIGFGVEGNVNANTAWQAVADGSPVDWPDANDFNSPDSTRANRARLDDLLHAAINGHGGFFNAADPQSFADGLDAVLGAIVAREEASVVPVAVSSDAIDEDTRMFSAGFRSIDWSGQLKGYQLLPGGKRKLLWDAESMLREQSPDDRLLLTSKGGNGVELAPQNSSLSADQVRWLKGASVDGMRSRIPDGQNAPNLLGDIVNSAPFLLSPPQESQRPGVIFVGANDGMLHAFSADSGKELFAYLPSELVTSDSGQASPLESLMQPDYTHRYFVDGSAVARNVEIDGGPEAVVVGTMGAGGRSVFALDVSDPADMKPEDVLWEFSNPNLGEGVTRPAISRVIYNGEPRWVALFGNGYNSVFGRASLFVVDLVSGDLLKRFDTNVGSLQESNGLGPPTATRWPDYMGASTYAYAGDQQGNMWRFDLTDLKFDLIGINNKSVRLLAGQSSQPITAPPQLEFKPGDSSTLMVLFGTGSFQFVDDRSDRSIQRLYGLEDNGDANPVPVEAETPNLAKQEITSMTRVDGKLVRGVTNKPVAENQRGWYLQLPPGERMVSMPTLPTGIYHQRALFATLSPLFGQCSAGIDGYVYGLRIDTGGSGMRAFFDVNGDKKIDGSDNITDQIGNVQIVAGLQLGSGQSQVAVNDPENDNDVLAGTIDSGGSGGGRIEASPGEAGRQSWRQVFNY
ncbi:pilus assembly protein [Modicisalibacter zincidurans]|uniref:PilC/PilY family type IV pilus protein n=1 Tax=Modicisalibacter zincidurans TaxID=1178777 RepID=A0ABP9R7J5_9GAMM|nr:PilC/PilY family type IV pilus protein [Halomonas zincidurans]